MTFGEKLRESRAKKGMTQSELAKAAKKKDVKNEQGTKIKQKNRPYFAGDVDCIFWWDECAL